MDRPNEPHTPLSAIGPWRRQLAILCLSQFLSITAFSFCFPIAPLYIKELHLVPENELESWVGIFIGAASLSMMVLAPVWGTLGDRFGRKMMLVRANLAGAFALFLMGSATSIESLIVLRLLQGAFTGTTPAAQSLIAATIPERRQGYALGMIVAAINAGSMCGQFLGGFCAAEWSAANTFRIGGLLLFASCLLVAFGAREVFVPPQRELKPRTAGRWRQVFRQGYWALALPVLGLTILNAFAGTLDQPVLPLFLQKLHFAGIANPTDADNADVYRISGLVNALAALAAIAGALWMGRLLDRPTIRRPILIAAGVAAAGELAIVFQHSIWTVALSRAGFAFGAGALGSVLAVWLGRASTPATRGAVFGWSVTTRAIGWAAAPMLGGLISSGLKESDLFEPAQTAGMRIVFVAAGVLFLAHIPWMLRLINRYPPPHGAGQPSERLQAVSPTGHSSNAPT